MDYRYYRGDRPEWVQKIQAKFGRHLYRLKGLGTVMLLLGVISPFLMVIKVLESTFFLSFISWGMTILGMMFWIIGFVWDNLIDRG